MESLLKLTGATDDPRCQKQHLGRGGPEEILYHCQWSVQDRCGQTKELFQLSEKIDRLTAAPEEIVSGRMFAKRLTTTRQ